ncbi:hypothetical protein HYT53_01260 [Candidatus Woesearchaeota archaeon]|nr:hypothetical protein [Candidatus Woesearchaeota archaeon]
MKLNKMLWIFALVLLVVIPSAFALPAFLRNVWVMLGVNSLIIWFILFALQTMIVPEKLEKEKTVLFIITLVASLLISWFLVGGGGYIWEVGKLAGFFSFKLIVNTIIISLVVYFGLGLAGVKPGTKEGQIGIALLAIGIGLLIAFNVGNEWLWKHPRGEALYNYLLGPEQPTGKKDSKGNDITEGGILVPPRLIVFGISAMLFVWFFTSYLMEKADPRLTWAIAIILAANLARRGNTYNAVIMLGEIFAILIIANHIAVGKGAAGSILGWIITIVLVETVFCVVFGNSALSQLFSGILKAFSDMWFVGGIFGKTAAYLNNICPLTTALVSGDIDDIKGIVKVIEAEAEKVTTPTPTIKGPFGITIEPPTKKEELPGIGSRSRGWWDRTKERWKKATE